jgi:uncharacterized protein (TIGR02453 family)
MLTARRYFTPDLFRFLRELKTNNRREWFAEHRNRYQRDVEGPLLQFIADLAPRLKRISPRFVADPRRTGGSMFRVYRDTRFSEDKSPFKTWVSARFTHDGRRGEFHVPGFYLHLEPGDCLGGGGIHHPDPPTLRRIRDRIVAAPREWDAVLNAGLAIDGDTLARVPSGFDPAHRFAADLKRKDHYTLLSFGAREVCSKDFLGIYTQACERTAPLVAFLTKALGLRW